VAWQRIAPHLLKQETPSERLVWYWDDGPLTTGELLLWLDAEGRIARFQLAHAPFPGTREYLADWARERGLRLGQVGRGEGTPHHKMAAIIRYQRPDARPLAQLADYFTTNAWVLNPFHRATVAAALAAPPMLSPPPPLSRRAADAAHAVSGKNGGRGSGTAATNEHS
jgi:hypothetical protein